MHDDLILAIDIGTTRIKAAAFDLRGRSHFDYAEGYPTHRAPGGIVEQNPADWLAGVAAILSRLRDRGQAGAVRAVGITSQVNTHVFTDAGGASLCPAIVWQDTRAADTASALDARLSDAQRMAWWGAPLPIDASHALARMGWMAEARPDIWDRTAMVLLPKDFVLRALTGAVISDPISNIGLVGGDLRYPGDLLALVPGVAARLPPLAAATDVAGEMRLAPGLAAVPVAVGVMDAWAGMTGAGMRGPGDAVYLSGTSEVLGIVSDDAAPVPGVLVFPRSGPIRLHAGPTQSGGASVAWFCAAFGVTPEQMESEAGAAQDAPLFLPHLAGERAPLWDAGARGAFLGLASDMGRGAMARAVYEGVAYSARLLLASLEASAMRRPTVLLCGGGGFRSDLWAQIRADVLGVPLRRAAVADAGLLGVAAHASVAAGLHPDLGAALADIVTHDREFDPDPRAAARHDDRFAAYLPAYHALRSLRLESRVGRAGNGGPPG